VWEMQASVFNLATHFGQYQATLRMSLKNEKDIVKDLIVA